jgi:rhodanese-related sulfurtransferase
MARELDPLSADDAARDGAVLLDVREPVEFETGHAPNARLIPLGDLPARAGELDPAHAIVCVCRSGHRSAHAADALTAAGFDAVNLAGGMLAWAAEGLPVVTEQGGAGAVL